MAKNKYYAVAVGRQPGIYNTWPECQEQVNGYPNAKFKGFPDEKDAKSYMVEALNPGVEDAETKEDPFSKTYAGRHTFIYVDGSYNKNTDCYGYGVYIGDEASPKIFVGNGPCKYGGNNIEGEIEAAVTALNYVKHSEKYDSVTICHDLKHIGLIGDHVEKPHTPYTMEYGTFVDQLRRSGLAIDFVHTKGHTGIIGNEYADKLARIGCGIPLTAKEQAFINQLKDVDGFPKQEREVPDVPGLIEDDYTLER